MTETRGDQMPGDADDPLYQDPYIEVEEVRTAPEPHRYVHGGFKNSPARFSFYFPPEARYQGRFHQNTYPLATSADIGPFPIAFDVATGNLGFTLDSGAYYVQTNNGGAFRQPDATIAAYRANAAAAKFSRSIATRLYGSHRPFGYLYGGSGGAYQTIGAAEHTRDVWDGFMPFVLGCNNAVPSLWAVRLHALRVLRKKQSLDAIMDAINPGGSGDPYAHLNAEQRAALHEATLMGFPPRGWYNHPTLHDGYFSDVYAVIPALDPGYEADFWSKPGYLGHDAFDSIAASRFEFETTIAAIGDGRSRRITLANVPDAVPEGELCGAHLTALSGAGAGHWLHIATAERNSVDFASTSDPAIVDSLRPGDRVRVDNRWLLAAQTYQRHQVPPDPAEYGWNQFRDAAGRPLYPQRDLLIGHFFARASVGSLLTGRIQGKMLLVQALMDVDALPWSADWYRSEVRKALGARFEQNFALWFIDHTQHDNPSTAIARAHTVSLAGALQQGLQDLARWVEKGERPADTAYTMNRSLVEVPADAAARRGIQPVITLSANGGLRADVARGESVTFLATIDVPAGAGAVVAAEWDFEGAGGYADAASVDQPQRRVQVSATHAYVRPGTYYPVLRATSHRQGDPQSLYGRVQDIARVRVVVR